MEREIKFKGKRKDTMEWVKGNLSIEYDGTYFISYWINTLMEPENNYWEMIQKSHVVIPETVGQFIGIKDINGEEIYECDLMNSNRNQINEIKYIDGGFRRVQLGHSYTYTPSVLQKDDIERFQLEITGNIHNIQPL